MSLGQWKPEKLRLLLNWSSWIWMGACKSSGFLEIKWLWLTVIGIKWTLSVCRLQCVCSLSFRQQKQYNPVSFPRTQSLILWSTFTTASSVWRQLINWAIKFKIQVKRGESCLITCHIINTMSLVRPHTEYQKRSRHPPNPSHMAVFYASVQWSGWGPSFSLVKCFHAAEIR